jgi:hypothetical protein
MSAFGGKADVARSVFAELTMIRPNLCRPSSISATKATGRENWPFRVGTRIASPQLTKDHRGSKKLEFCRETKIERVLTTLLRTQSNKVANVLTTSIPNSIKHGRNKATRWPAKTESEEAERKAAGDGAFWGTRADGWC